MARKKKKKTTSKHLKNAQRILRKGDKRGKARDRVERKIRQVNSHPRPTRGPRVSPDGTREMSSNGMSQNGITKRTRRGTKKRMSMHDTKPLGVRSQDTLSPADIHDIAMMFIEVSNCDIKVAEAYGVHIDTARCWRYGKKRPEIKAHMDSLLASMRERATRKLTLAKVKAVDALVDALEAKTVAVTANGTVDVDDNQSRIRAAKALLEEVGKIDDQTPKQVIQGIFVSVLREMTEAGILVDQVRKQAEDNPIGFIMSCLDTEQAGVPGVPVDSANAVSFMQGLGGQDVLSGLRALPVKEAEVAKCGT